MFSGEEIAFPVSAVLSADMVTSVGTHGKGGLGWDGTVSGPSERKTSQTLTSGGLGSGIVR